MKGTSAGGGPGRPLRILIANGFHYVRGGADRCYLEQVSLLGARGHTVIPFSTRDSRNLETPYASYFVSPMDFPERLGRGGIRNGIQVAERVIYSREARDRMRDLLRETRPDVAHIHGLWHELSPSILPVLRRAGIPVAQTLHDYKLLCPNSTFVSGESLCERCKVRRYHNVVLRRCKRNSLTASLLACAEAVVHKMAGLVERNVNLFLTPSRFLLEKLREYGVPTRAVHVPNFIDAGRFSPCYEPEDYFVYAGRLVGVKGVRTLLAAMRRVKGARLYVAGRGDLEGELKDYARREGLGGVVFAGHLDADELKALLRRARAMVVPSEWYENYSMTVLEAFASGIPVIASAIGGLPEQVREGETGYLFPPGDGERLAEAMLRLAEHPEEAVRMGRNARLQVEAENAPGRHYEHLISLYRELMEEGAAAGSPAGGLPGL
ncbi:MAG: glycosyltransferase family 4 protein [Bacteroidota bacterium]